MFIYNFFKFSIIILICLISNQYALAEQKRIALVIGNSNYKTAPLKNPINDAKAITAQLSQFGFQVEQLLNASQREMEESIRSFGKSLNQKDAIGLFYFAGHGMQVNNRNYLIPVDATVDNEADVEFETIDAGRVLAQMEFAQNNLNIIILDACRNNPFTRNLRSSSRGLAKMYAPQGSVILYATSPGDVASDGTGNNGLFTEKLIESMKPLDLKVEEVFKQTAIEVSKATRKKQVPYFEGVILGDFYFNSGKPTKQKQITVSNPKLTKQTIEKLLIGKTIKGRHLHKGFDFSMSIHKDGTITEERNNESLTGVWKIKDDDRYCFKFDQKKRMKCRYIRQLNDNKFEIFKKDGRTVREFKIDK